MFQPGIPAQQEPVFNSMEPILINYRINVAQTCLIYWRSPGLQLNGADHKKGQAATRGAQGQDLKKQSCVRVIPLLFIKKWWDMDKWEISNDFMMELNMNISDTRYSVKPASHISVYFFLGLSDEENSI